MLCVNSVFQRSLVYFFVSFIGTGIQNVIPQHFFSQYYEEDKTIWLSLCLVVGSVGSIVVVWWMNHVHLTISRMKWETSRLIIVVVMITIIMTTISLFFVISIWLFILCFVLTRTLTQFLINMIDHHYVATIDKEKVQSHAKNAALFQLFGIMLAPIYFAIIINDFLLNSAILLILALCTLYYILLHVRKGNVETDKTIHVQSKGVKLPFQDILFLIYVISLASASMLFSSNMIFLFADYFRIDNPTLKGASMLTVMNITAIIAVFLTKKKMKPSPAVHLKIAIGMLLSTLLMFLLPVHTFSVFLLIGVVMGYIYGLFFLTSRQYAAFISVEENKPWLLAIYNNNSSYAVIISSVTFFAIAIVTRFLGVNYINYVVMGITIFITLSIVAVSLRGLLKGTGSFKKMY